MSSYASEGILQNQPEDLQKENTRLRERLGKYKAELRECHEKYTAELQEYRENFQGLADQNEDLRDEKELAEKKLLNSHSRPPFYRETLPVSCILLTLAEQESDKWQTVLTSIELELDRETHGRLVKIAD